MDLGAAEPLGGAALALRFGSARRSGRQVPLGGRPQSVNIPATARFPVRYFGCSGEVRAGRFGRADAFGRKRPMFASI